MPLSGIVPLKPFLNVKNAPRERSLKAVCGDCEGRDCAHRSDAAFGNCSFEAVCTDTKTCDCAHPSDAALGNRSFEAVL
eukprot:615347-Amphidinium_carterae.1